MNDFTLFKKQLLFLCCLIAFAYPNANAQSYGGFSFEPVVSCNGKTISMVARTDTWSNVVLFQFAMEWDSNVLEYVDTTLPNNTFQDLGFGDTFTSSGKLTASWFDPTTSLLGVSPENEVAFTIIFNVIGDAGDQTPLAFTNAIPIEFYYDNNGTTTEYTSDVILVDGQVDVTSKPSVDMETIVEASTSSSSDGSITVNITGGTAPYDVLWSNDEFSMNLMNLSVGNYSCTVTDVNTCSTANGPYSVEATVSSNNIKGLNNFNLSPNPANDFVNINVDFAKSEKTSIRIIDVAGKIRYQQNREAAAFSLDVPVSDFANGTYFVEIATANGKAVEKLLVAK
ncbi:MAG: hypothetical protein ACI9XB_003312 [Gammaproteobacteria bacterium]|jgi:hypothetical protein